MNILDLILGILLLLSFIGGYRDGLIRRVFVLAGVIIGLILATRYTHAFAAVLSRVFALPQTVASVVAFLIIFIGILIIARMIAKSISKENVLVKLWDRLLGGVFGMIEGGIILSLLLLFLNLVGLPPENLKARSLLYDRVLNCAPTIFNVITKIVPGSRDFYKEIGRSIDRYNFFKEDK